MKWHYRCPACDTTLNPHEAIMVVADWGGRRLLMGFHPEPGNYEVFLPPDVQVVPRAAWEFYCPVCHANLAVEDGDDLCHLDLDEDGVRKKVVFSRIAGEHATFLLGADGLEAHHGPQGAERLEQVLARRFFVGPV